MKAYLLLFLFTLVLLLSSAYAQTQKMIPPDDWSHVYIVQH